MRVVNIVGAPEKSRRPGDSIDLPFLIPSHSRGECFQWLAFKCVFPAGQFIFSDHPSSKAWVPIAALGSFLRQKKPLTYPAVPTQKTAAVPRISGCRPPAARPAGFDGHRTPGSQELRASHAGDHQGSSSARGTRELSPNREARNSKIWPAGVSRCLAGFSGWTKHIAHHRSRTLG